MKRRSIHFTTDHVCRLSRLGCCVTTFLFTTAAEARRPRSTRGAVAPWPTAMEVESWMLSAPVAAGVVLRGVAVCYLIVFLSISRQLPGLVGSAGIFPAARLLRHVAQEHAAMSAPRRWLMMPTLLCVCCLVLCVCVCVCVCVVCVCVMCVATTSSGCW